MGHHVVDAAVVIVFGAAAPDAEVGHGFTFQKLRGEYPGCGHLGGLVMFQDGGHLLVIITLGHGFCGKGGGHRRHGFLVVVHAVILRADGYCGS